MKFKEHILSLLAPAPKPAVELWNGVTLYGDSIAAGLPRWLMPALVQHRYDTLHDRSIPGDTARNAWARFPYERRSTKVVILQPGTNDLTVGDDPVPYLKEMADYAIREGRNVILTGISPREGIDVNAVNVRIWRAAEDVGARFAYWHYTHLAADDGLHPNDSMYEQLANLLGIALKGYNE